MSSSSLPREPIDGDEVITNLKSLRDSLVPRAFDSFNRPKNAELAEVVFKINSCLFLHNQKF